MNALLAFLGWFVTFLSVCLTSVIIWAYAQPEATPYQLKLRAEREPRTELVQK